MTNFDDDERKRTLHITNFPGMRVLMFGWEFPPHISGGLGTACLGLTQALVRQNVDLLFVVPRLHGNEPSDRYTLVSASEVIIPFSEDKQVPIPPVTRKIKSVIYNTAQGPTRVVKEKLSHRMTEVAVTSALKPYESPELRERSWTVENWNYRFEPGEFFNTAIEVETEEEVPPTKRGYTYSFSGAYGDKLMEEITEYARVAAELAKDEAHDIVHAHDWMTYPAGIAAKEAGGKPLVIHVHSTEFDRSGNCNGPVFDIELKGMQVADRIVAVSEWTKNIIVKRYNIDAEKVTVIHNGVVTDKGAGANAVKPLGSHMVTFLGRVTHQKGPAYFVEAAKKVSHFFPDVHFIVAGSGDLLPQTINRVAELRLSNRFHFTGFLDKDWIKRIWSMTSVYVMPSVSEPFGITPLEAIQAGVPVIVSNQSGVAEVMPHALKVDFWDTEALAASICSVLRYKSLSSFMKKRGEKELKNLSWTKAAVKLKSLYEETAP